ncbi:RNA polymerase-associated protein RapA [Entomomonas moraniae]|uniref:RNA polymerase-associated protein RapA n=1 Tax=Entomomonas moraniae TaxID=2213226 RepID=A0A3Q9JL16_9GAMM|nr:RNA polymerase-associated protein RapA [Entomomonas moraniae]AZS52108.1 RNA polymerase-associated protein RapA [Entomomonas moraniae]
MQYLPGQRWISDSEAELGLGTIISQEGRLLTILFPATGETRQYSANNASLTRVQYSIGDKITHIDGWQVTVDEVMEIDGLLVYMGLDEQNKKRTISETQLSNFIQFRSASDRLFAGQVDSLSWFSLRYHTFEHMSQLQQSKLLGLSGARVQPIAHQMHIAREVADRIAPRVLLADEVGLGKTIEAGLIIHRQVLSGRALRVLIIVPENLQHQWLVEMRRRFNLEVTLFDAERYAQITDANPFEDSQLVLVALDWLVSDERVQDALFAAGWDMLVVDEAHHLVWVPDYVSPEYTLVEQLAESTPSVLLLTATPEQLGIDSHFARLRLLDPNRFHSLEAFREESKHYQPVAEAVQELLDKQKLSKESRKTIESFLGKQAEKALLDAAAKSDEDACARLIRELLDRHGTGRLLFRNTRAAVHGFPIRILHHYALPNPEQYLQIPRDERPILTPEIDYIDHQLETDSERWWHFDSRVDWLISTLKMLKHTKVLVICAHAETVIDLEEALRVREGIAAAVFHEGMTIIERDRAAAYFSDEEGAQLLVCSEIGSEGRNFQFAHHLVLFDLPPHPDLLEQRIGRLDRIGQQNDIQIHVPYIQGTAQERLFEWYDLALNAFVNTCPAGSALQTQFRKQLREHLEGTDQKEWSKLVETAKQLRLELEAEMQKGRDRLLELNSSGGSEGNEIVEAIAEQDDQYDLPMYAEQLFDAFGIDVEDHSDNAFVLRPGEKMLDSGFPLGDEEGVTITYDRSLALSREDMQFITWEHPMLQGGMDLVISGSMGNTAVAVIKNKALKTGTVLIEFVFIAEVIAPKALQLVRYLPKEALRCLLDAKGNNLADKVSFETLNKQLEKVPRGSAVKFVKAQRTMLEKQVLIAEQKMQTVYQEKVAEAKQRFVAEMDEELARLVALKAVNPNVRDNELAILEEYKTLGCEYLDKATLRLDAIRILVAG